MFIDDDLSPGEDISECGSCDKEALAEDGNPASSPNDGGWAGLERGPGTVDDSAPSSVCGCVDDDDDNNNNNNDHRPPSSSEWDDLEHDLDVLDVLIIGGGPAGLAAAARIREQAPAAMFTDEEHRRYTWLGKHGRKLAIKKTRTGEVSPAKRAPEPEYTMKVLDATSDDWLGSWKDRFATFDIRHLRSPMIWHVDPQDRDSLLRHVERNGTPADMIEIKGCVGKEVSKHRHKTKYTGSRKDSKVDINYRDQNDYHRPSQSIFCDHCDNVARHYHLHNGVVHKETVRDIRYGITDEVPSANNIFTVVTNKRVRYARAVILAVGPANSPVLPTIPSLSYPGKSPTSTMPQASHSMKIQRGSFPCPLVQRRIRERRRTNILVVGGGLTSAQLADLALRSGVSRVWHIMRGPVKQKHFDVPLDWMGKFKTKHQEAFHAANTDEARLDIIKAARDGGSTTPEFHRRVTKPHIASGKLELRLNTVLTAAHFEGGVDDGAQGGGLWRVQTEPPIEGLPPMDFLCFATGIQSDFTTLPYLQHMLQDYPIQGVGGFPCLNEDLMWADDVPLFVAGRLAALRLGPAAANIGGARVGAERIALALDEQLAGGHQSFFRSEWDTVKGGERDGEVDQFNYACAVGSKYSCLPETSE